MSDRTPPASGRLLPLPPPVNTYAADRGVSEISLVVVSDDNFGFNGGLTKFHLLSVGRGHTKHS